ncbi:MAG: FAD-binding oxidoreductase [Anaerolineales bacterium]
MQQQIYWHTTVQMPNDKNLTHPEKVDVAIIGGGYTGLSAARTLAKRGIKVVVLEAETIGWGASSRNGGMTLTGPQSRHGNHSQKIWTGPRQRIIPMLFGFSQNSRANYQRRKY